MQTASQKANLEIIRTGPQRFHTIDVERCCIGVAGIAFFQERGHFDILESSNLDPYAYPV
jgi:hypothetical protein